jgi:hypothetical protein
MFFVAEYNYNTEIWIAEKTTHSVWKFWYCGLSHISEDFTNEV